MNETGLEEDRQRPYKERYLVTSAALLVGCMWTYAILVAALSLYLFFSDDLDILSLWMAALMFAIPLLLGAAVYAAVVTPIYLLLEQFDPFRTYPIYLLLSATYTVGICAFVYVMCSHHLCYF